MSDAPDLGAAAGRFLDMLTGASVHAPAVMEAAGRYLQVQAIIATGAAGLLILGGSGLVVWNVRRCLAGSEAGIPGVVFGALAGLAGAGLFCAFLPSAISPALALAGYVLSAVRP